MAAKVEIIRIVMNERPVWVIVKNNKSNKLFLSEHSYLGEVPIRQGISRPRVLEEFRNADHEYLILYLKNGNDRHKLKEGEILEIWSDYVDAEDSYKFSDGRMLAFLKCYPGKLDTPLTMTDEEGKSWVIRSIAFISGSVETYKLIEQEVARNVFQYFIEPIDHEEKPINGSRLRVSKIKWDYLINCVSFNKRSS